MERKMPKRRLLLLVGVVGVEPEAAAAAAADGERSLVLAAKKKKAVSLPFSSSAFWLVGNNLTCWKDNDDDDDDDDGAVGQRVDVMKQEGGLLYDEQDEVTRLMVTRSFFHRYSFACLIVVVLWNPEECESNLSAPSVGPAHASVRICPNVRLVRWMFAQRP
jgi:hypothetical protein